MREIYKMILKTVPFIYVSLRTIIKVVRRREKEDDSSLVSESSDKKVLQDFDKFAPIKIKDLDFSSIFEETKEKRFISSHG